MVRVPDGVGKGTEQKKWPFEEVSKHYICMALYDNLYLFHHEW